jgi:iron complex outermembrane receptor protein
MRGYVAYFFVCSLIAAVFLWFAAVSAETAEFNIPSQSLEDALLEFSRQSNKAVLIEPDVAAGRMSGDVRGDMLPDDALMLLLQSTSLHFRRASDDGYIILAHTVAPSPSGVRDITRLEEIIVTAEKRVASIQDVAIAVSAFSEYTLNRNQVRTLHDMSALVPGLHTSAHGDTNALDISMRGIVSNNRTELGDPAVAFHIDGIYSPRPQGAGILMYDVERIEILRGPQGTLFGRNASIGSINIETAKPKLDNFEGKTSYTIGDYDRLGIKGAMNIPVTDNYAIRVAAYTDRHDAYVTTIQDYSGYYSDIESEDLNGFRSSPEVGIRGYEAEEKTSWRIGTLWKIADNIDWFFAYEFYKDNGTGAIDLDPFIVNNFGGARVAVVDSPGQVGMTIRALRSRFDAGYGDIGFSYMLGMTRQERSQIWDADLGRTGEFEEHRTEYSNYDSISHEMQLKSLSDSTFQWLLGLYTSREDNSIRLDFEQSDSGGAVSFRQPSRRLLSSAIFAQGTYSLTPVSRITLGMRSIIDRKTDTNGRNIGCGSFIRRPDTANSLNGIIPPNGELFNAFDYGVPGSAGGNAIVVDRTDPDTGEVTRLAVGVANPDDIVIAAADPNGCWIIDINDVDAEWDATTGLLRLEHDFTDDVMFYWGTGTGFKSGIIQDAGFDAEPETIRNMELGLKSMLMDNRLQLNAALFAIDYKNLQVSRELMLDQDNDGIDDFQGSLYTQNAARASIYGLELEFDWLFGLGGRLGAVATFLDATYDEFDTVDQFWGQDNPWNPPSDDPELAALGFVSLEGNKLIRAPDYTVTLLYEHELFTNRGSWTPRIKVLYSDKMFLDEHNRTSITTDEGETFTNLSVQPAYTTVDLSLRYTSAMENWLLEFFINNATDENIRTGLGNYIGRDGFSSYYLPPKIKGVTLEYSFE